ncbi:hypothetical protein M5585_17090 [Serratia ureilytica]
MFSHITVGVSDLDAAAAFYDAILLPLGLQRREVTPDGGPAARCWVMPGQTLPRFYAYQPFDGQPASAGNGSMLAFSPPMSWKSNALTPPACWRAAAVKASPANARITARAISALTCAIPTATRSMWCTGAISPDEMFGSYRHRRRRIHRRRGRRRPKAMSSAANANSAATP